MNFGLTSSLSIQLISGYGLGILLVSSDQKHKLGSPSAKTKTFKKDQSGVTTLILNMAGPIPFPYCSQNQNLSYIYFRNWK